jgi:hypothetical protein
MPRVLEVRISYHGLYLGLTFISRPLCSISHAFQLLYLKLTMIATPKAPKPRTMLSRRVGCLLSIQTRALLSLFNVFWSSLLNSQLADDQIRGFANFVRESYATKEQALKAWNTFCQNHHGNRCPNAARTFWGIKGLTAMFESRWTFKFSFFFQTILNILKRWSDPVRRLCRTYDN